MKFEYCRAVPVLHSTVFSILYEIRVAGTQRHTPTNYHMPSAHAHLGTTI